KTHEVFLAAAATTRPTTPVTTQATTQAEAFAATQPTTRPATFAATQPATQPGQAAGDALPDFGYAWRKPQRLSNFKNHSQLSYSMANPYPSKAAADSGYVW